MPNEQPVTDPRKALFIARIIWAALLVGQIVFMTVALTIRSQHIAADNPDRPIYLFYVALAMLIGIIPIAIFARRMVYGNGAVAPAKYLSGNIVFLAMIEGASLFGIVTMMVDTPPFPGLLVPVLAMAVQAINFPTGTAMESR